MLRLFNSLTKTKEIFKPIISKQITMYVCGITVYDHCHLGHARCMIVFDMMANYFRHLGYDLKFVRNITDIDDKIIKKAQEQHVDYELISKRFIESMQEDAAQLEIIAPWHEPKATEHIQDMISMIETLIEKQFAYVASNGDVCFAVEKFPDYGKLSRQNTEQLLSGVRVDVNEGKRFPLDFVLWKQAKPGEPSWPSPWGEGRPGWHIECSAMAKHHLGKHIDIHGGGLDLQFPHHENEIAQSEACNAEPFANYWLHVGLLQINNEKMAKSTGNFLTIKDALKLYHPEVIKLFFMTSHYRSPLNLSDDGLNQSHKTLQRLYQTLKLYSDVSDNASTLNQDWLTKFNDAMNDDFNTSEALAVIFELNNQINKEASPELLRTLLHIGQILGILKVNPQAFLTFSTSLEGLSNEEIENLIQERKEARKSRDFQKADQIRQLLQKNGIELEDSNTGTSWRRLV